jgi:hypothetical protein
MTQAIGGTALAGDPVSFNDATTSEGVQIMQLSDKKKTQMKIEANESGTLHSLYVAVHRAHKDAPTLWTDHECNRVLTAIMAAKRFSWRVVGITPNALWQFSKDGFRYKSKQGFTRAHIKSRIETVRYLLAKDDPVPEAQFIATWLYNDQTVICSRGENKAQLPEYITIDNDDGTLFSCYGKLAGWHHGKREIEFLRNLFDQHFPK